VALANVYTSLATLRACYHFTQRNGDLIYQATVNRYLGLHVKCPIIFSILIKFGVSRQILIKFPNTKFYGNESGASGADTCGQTDRHRRTDGHKANERIFATMNARPKKTFLRVEISFLVVVSRNSFSLNITIILIFLFCFFVSQQPVAGKDLLNIGSSRSHSDAAHSIGLLWTSD